MVKLHCFPPLFEMWVLLLGQEYVLQSDHEVQGTPCGYRMDMPLSTTNGVEPARIKSDSNVRSCEFFLRSAETHVQREREAASIPFSRKGLFHDDDGSPQRGVKG